MNRRLLGAMLSCAFYLAFGDGPVWAQNTCPQANPNDQLPDDAALQACLDQGGLITLLPGTGYIVEIGLHLTQDWTVLTTAGPGKATILADRFLEAPILRVNDGVSHWEISYIVFNGHKAQRRDNVYCDWNGYRDYGSNVLGRGSHWTIHHIDSIHALCGSALEVSGSDFEVRDNYIAHNGYDSGDGSPWSDGITIHYCNTGYIARNTVIDSTDVGIVSGGGNCRIEGNTIEQVGVHAFAAMHVGNFDGGYGLHTNAVFSGNTITSAYDKAAFGLVVGYHPWDPFVPVDDAGSITDNSSNGAVVNLAIDGVGTGTVQSNRMSNAQGTWGLNCDLAADYTAGDVYGALSYQSGWVPRRYHPYCR